MLSLDLSGPFHVAPDLHSRSAKYLLVGAFTWLSPDQGGDDFEDSVIPEVPKDAPELEAEEAEEIRDEDDVWGSYNKKGKGELKKDQKQRK